MAPMSQNDVQKKINELITILSANPLDEVVLKHLNEIRSIGNERIIPPLIHILCNTDNQQVYQEVSQLLFDIKNPKCIPLIIESLQSPTTIKHRSTIASALWQCSLSLNEYIPSLVDIALNNDYYTCVEILSCIENLSGPLDDQKLIQSLDLLNKNLSTDVSPKTPLLEELKNILETHLLN